MPPILKVENVSRFFGGVAAIAELSFDLDANQVLGLIGPNGAGKTTLFNLITGFLRPNRGEIYFQDRRLVGLKPHRIVARGVTRTFQIPKPFGSLNCLENVAVSMVAKTGLARRHDPEILRRSRGIMETTGLADKEGMRPEALTQGDLKKLEIARALATSPRLLLLDEPFAGLTNAEIAAISDLIRQVHGQGMAMIIVEHRLRELMRIVQRVVALDFGEKIAEGTPQEITNHPRVIEAYLGTGG
ncbi:MAG: ABC transporter ATP-binding protein [Thermodesulfobacteriota bacterium]